MQALLRPVRLLAARNRGAQRERTDDCQTEKTQTIHNLGPRKRQRRYNTIKCRASYPVHKWMNSRHPVTSS